MLNVAGLTVSYPGRHGAVTAVSDVSLTVGAGQIVGLVGESGAGKTTIAAAIIGLLPPNAKVAQQALRLGDTDLAQLTPAQRHAVRGRRISMIFQDPQTSLNPLMTIEDQLVETILTHEPIGAVAARARAIGLLEQTGIQDAALRIKAYPHQFSGGMRQRVVIALALCTNPELIIADEPTSALDVAVQSQVVALLRRLASERGVGILLITHDIGMIGQLADRVVVLRHGKVVEAGETAQVLGHPSHAYTRALMSAVPRLDRRLHRFIIADVIADGPGGGERDDEGGDEVPVAAPLGPGAANGDLAEQWLMQGVRAGAPDGQSPMLSIEGLAVRFAGVRTRLLRRPAPIVALQEIELRVGHGEVVGVVGESGSGKSTLARAIVGLVQPSQGQMWFRGQQLAAARQRTRHDPVRRQVQMIFQDPYSSLNNRFRIVDILAEPLSVYGLERDAGARRRLAASAMALVGLPPDALDRHPHQFSGGQRQRIAIARALLARPEFLICDEPTSALDVSMQAQILNLLKDLQQRFGLTILFISHNLAVVRQMVDQVVVLKAGRIVESGPTEAFFAGPRHAYSRQLLALTPSLPY